MYSKNVYSQFVFNTLSEGNCGNWNPPNSNNEIYCGDDDLTKIHPNQICDNDQDCPNGADEANCPNPDTRYIMFQN